mgnify:CR=1 FL=1
MNNTFEMKKDFEGWNEKKKKLHSKQSNLFYHEREIWWCSLGVNIGFEQDGTGKNFDRPIIVIRGFNKNIFFAVALIGKRKTGKYYFYVGKIENKEASAVLSQARLIDAKRLIRKIGVLDEKVFNNLKGELK